MNKEIAIEEDGDEMFYLPTHCVNFKCQTWDDDDNRISPSLAQDKEGDWFCPMCRASYGK